LLLEKESVMQVVNDPLQLYQEADEAGIDVVWMPLRVDRSIATQFDDGSCAIGLDPWKMCSLAEETVCLGHELGHCNTGSFYNRYAKLDIRKKHENRADKWEIKRLIPVDDLDEAVAEGHTEIWDLAEYFGVTEDFMRKVVCWYTHGNLATELYF
jgi:hypothetical protein